MINMKATLSLVIQHRTTVTMLLAGLMIMATVQRLNAETYSMNSNGEFQQDITVEGQVIDSSTGEPLPGVTVQLEGTTTGTSTDADGNYELTAPEDGTLLFSFVGYESVDVSIDGRNVINIELVSSAIELQEAVVTAIGLERDRRTIGYAITQVSSEDLVQGTEANVANLLQGQVAGVNVAPVGGGPGASTRVTIRGASSLTGDNQPLYVVDGIPIDNTNIGSAGKFGGFDGGDGIQSLNPNDIESISVLKGASAAALYGERARDGVVLITTKQGSAEQVSVTFTSSTTLEEARIHHDEVQTTYGQGSEGRRPQDAITAWEQNFSSWGEPFDGQPTIQWDGVERPYEDLGSAVENFYQTGINLRNNISVSGGVENTSYYFSASQLNNQSIFPNSDLNRTSMTVRGVSTIGRLTADLKANYIDEGVNNRPGISGSSNNPNRVMQLVRNVPLSSIEENYKTEDGMENNIVRDAIFTQNPYWVINEYRNWDDRDRLIGHAKLDFEVADWLQLTGRTGLDWYTLRRHNVLPWGTAHTPAGNMSENEYRIREANTDVYLNAYYNLTPSIVIDGILGGALRNRTSETIGAGGSSFTIPGLNTLSNMEQATTSYGYSEKEIHSVYSSANIGFNDYLFLNLTGRNDWSSTLPPDNNSFFYPSVSASFLFSDAFASSIPQWLSHGQLRASWGEVGSDTDPYQLNLTYAIFDLTHQGQPLGYIAQGSIPLADLKPTLTQEVELGFDVRFFDDRLGVDFAWYDRQTINQILSTPVPRSTGYTGRVVNAGQLDNTGFEIQLNTVPIIRPEFYWRSTANYGRNKGVVRELVEGQDLMIFGENRTETLWVTAQAGEEFGTLRGFTYARDEEGNIIHENGLPVQGDLEILGRGTPDWTVSWSNTLSWKDFMFNAMIDVQWGGQIFSGTDARLYGSGLHTKTLPGRAACDETRGANGQWAPDCFIAEGVDIDGGTNTTGVIPSSYYGRIPGIIAEEFVYDRNLIQLRQLQLGYNLPVEWIGRLGLRAASISLVGRNVFFIYNSVPNIDPESSYNRSNEQGHEHMGIPNTRSIGLNINLQF